MSRYPQTWTSQQTPTRWRRVVVGFAVLALCLVTLGHSSGAVAQDALSISGTSNVCNPPPLPPGTPTLPESQSGASASPTAEPVVATPEISAPVGTRATGEAADEIAAGVQNIINCVNSGYAIGSVALMTPNFLLQIFGTGNPYDVLANQLLQGATFANVQIANEWTYSDGSATAEVSYFQSLYQVVTERWTLIYEDGFYKAERLDPLNPSPDGATVIINMTMGGRNGEYTFTPSQSTIPETDVIILHGINAGAMAHEIRMFRFPEEITIDDIINADDEQVAQIGQQAEFIAQQAYFPSTEGDIALVNLPAGTYTILCSFISPSGQPHYQLGMVTRITVVSSESTASPATTPAP